MSPWQERSGLFGRCRPTISRCLGRRQVDSVPRHRIVVLLVAALNMATKSTTAEEEYEANLWQRAIGDGVKKAKRSPSNV